MQVKLVAFDLDGTFLDDDKNIPPENLLALEEAAARGVVLVPATGRIVRGIPETIKSLPAVRYFIVSNGAGVYDAREDRLVHRADIPLALALRCYEYLDTLPVLYDCYQDDAGYMTLSMLESAPEIFGKYSPMLQMLRQLRRPVPELKAYLREKGRPLQKLQAFFREEDYPLRAELLQTLPQRFPELTPTTSVPFNIEINSAHAGKGKALRALCALLGIPPEQSLAFGDGTNDRELLELAGFGMAMANADPAVLAAADGVTGDNNHAGFAEGLRRMLQA